MLRSILPAWLAPSEAKAADNDAHQNGNSTAPTIITQDDEDTAEGDSTPKAGPTAPDASVPSFTLNEDDEPERAKKAMPPPPVPSFPAANRVQRVSAMPPPPKPASKSSSSLMPPPSRPAAQTPRQSPAAGLRVPTTGPLPNRGPPANSQQRVNGGLSPNGTAVSTPNPRGKVLLKPGHSPMDWAALTRSGNLSGVQGFQRVTPSELKKMTGRKGKPAWSSWQGKVYNITPYLPFHPGGEAELMKAAGRDGTKLFMEVHPWVNWDNMLQTCLVGVLVPENYGMSESSELEDID
ncbi:Cytochrome b5 reductase 4 [Pseudocercospora fuligena]|uniref:Cytochrome b5 reductase 4 n=1 Tax=Pseudocercospora fuligena TaxID=685502 RepID=A0A8H6RK52_9PEZI|nr:Cytochrome b5 reductase 4 [Pseudocercospora fuligena]